MARRSQARAIVLQMLFQMDINPDVDHATVRVQIAERITDEGLRDLAWQMFTGTMTNRDALDATIEATAENWRLTRMAVTDRNVLRLGSWEILHTDTPVPVVIDEAIDLAKKFGSKQSPQFVNGLLDRLTPPDRKDASRT